MKKILSAAKTLGSMGSHLQQIEVGNGDIASVIIDFSPIYKKIKLSSLSLLSVIAAKFTTRDYYTTGGITK